MLTRLVVLALERFFGFARNTKKAVGSLNGAHDELMEQLESVS